MTLHNTAQGYIQTFQLQFHQPKQSQKGLGCIHKLD